MLTNNAVFFGIIFILCNQPNIKIYIFDRYGKLLYTKHDKAGKQPVNEMSCKQ